MCGAGSRVTRTRSCASAKRARAGSAAGAAVSSYKRKDHYHQRAKSEGFRSRAIYKLAEVQKAHRLLRSGDRVVDLGCWPGGWLQEAARVVGARGRVVGVDRVAVDPPLTEANVVTLVGDLEDANLCDRIRKELAQPCDVLLSDAAPKLTGLRDVDRANEERLLQAIANVIPKLLKSDGDLLLKVLEGPEAAEVERGIRAYFAKAKTVKVGATRKGSTERYLLARGFRAPK
jgi:23S rRNA (uridine2552-2'-O)-methyltransferase